MGTLAAEYSGAGIGGAVGAVPVDQASRLRALVESMAGTRVASPAQAPARRVPVIAIASGKGGVGKTNLAVNLSIAFAQAGRRATLLDADLGMANADVLCGLTPGRRLDDVLRDPSGPGLASCIVRAPGGFLLVPGAVGVARVADLDEAGRQRMVDQLEDLESRSDLVLIDTGAGVGRDVLSFAVSADWVVVVVTPEPTSITDAYGLIKCVLARSRERGGTPPRLALVINETRGPAEADAVSARLGATCERFLGCQPTVLGGVRLDRKVGKSVRKRRPHLLASPRSSASRDIRAIGRRLESLVWDL